MPRRTISIPTELYNRIQHKRSETLMMGKDKTFTQQCLELLEKGLDER